MPDFSLISLRITGASIVLVENLGDCGGIEEGIALRRIAHHTTSSAKVSETRLAPSARSRWAASKIMFVNENMSDAKGEDMPSVLGTMRVWPRSLRVPATPFSEPV